MIGAEEVSGFGQRVAGVGHAHRLRVRDQLVEQVESGVAGNGEVARRAMRVKRIHVDVGDGFRQRIERVGGVVLRSQQSFFLGGDIQEHHRARWSRLLCEGAAQFDQCRSAGAVVDRTVVDAIAFRIGRTHPQVIPVRAVDDRLVRAFAAFDAAADVLRRDDVGIDLLRARHSFAFWHHRL